MGKIYSFEKLDGTTLNEISFNVAVTKLNISRAEKDNNLKALEQEQGDLVSYIFDLRRYAQTYADKNPQTYMENVEDILYTLDKLEKVIKRIEEEENK